MPDIIRLLPDSVANQIAAGEVIQRPASAVKELLENAIDSGATQIKLIIRDAGKTLIQVVDNGCGMSETDARLSFERHATSKIKEAADLFNIRTMGFRGEALASIAAIAQVELKSKRIGDAIGTIIQIEGSEVKSQEACQCPEGTAFLVKNLFFNVPARRNFLKTDAVETKHILEEFYRVAIPFHNIAFELHHNNNEVHRLPATTQLKQRIVNLFGNNYNEHLLNVSAETGICSISGFTGKAEHAKKTRGEQYFFVNKRFIKNAYLHHAVVTAYEEMLPANSFPSYFLFIETDPQEIDINIHPTKTEIKFRDEKSIYAILKASVKQALGKFGIGNTLEFDIEKSMDVPPLRNGETVRPPSIKINPDYNPFEKKTGGAAVPSSQISKSYKENWEKLYSKHSDNQLEFPQTEMQKAEQQSKNEFSIEPGYKQIIQLHSSFIIKQIKSGMLIVDQKNAHERILFEHFLEHLKNRSDKVKQQKMFPEVHEFSPSDSVLLKEIIHDINATGFDLDEFGTNAFVVNAVPADMPECNSKQILENLLEQFKNSGSTSSDERNILIAKSLARTFSVKHGKVMQVEEMQDLVDRLFACSVPNLTPDGSPTYEITPLADIEKKFR
jgi:DNA mismatch repair protein MutL